MELAELRVSGLRWTLSVQFVI
jgi:hypothetical protein